MILNGGISCLERHERWQKQTERNRCHIVTANGTQCLTVPVTVPQSHCTTDDVLISDHGNWQHLHWNALCSETAWLSAASALVVKKRTTRFCRSVTSPSAKLATKA